eukprot:CAMPEP_0206428014 /NCGR_PEP_ID=MMETSP0324_2-20121206/5396_1 /ASSEMBLY_ACC=CAM_ASM_000836 /TAXON_ID=2866 /ORGANISM="Crypthecodinium cohnii, Strain Seligo" /LENGTH=455 /DNA_ID=CAMNT_0053893429 /DNA_START=87 /DNA_END=1455 /DNA_ORIENTATION=-
MEANSSSPLPKGQVPVRRPLIGSKFAETRSGPAGWTSNAQSPGIHWGVTTTPQQHPLWSPYNPWGSWEPYVRNSQGQNRQQPPGMTLRPPHLEPPPGTLHGTVDSLHEVLRDVATPATGRSAEAESQRMRAGLSKVVDSLGKCLQALSGELPPEEMEDGLCGSSQNLTRTIPGGAREYMPDRADPSRQRRRELQEDRFRVAAAREALARQRRKAAGRLGESGFGEVDRYAEPGRVPTVVPDEDVAATLLLLGCLRDVAESRREEIFPEGQALTLEQRMVVDFLDSCHTPPDMEDEEEIDDEEGGGGEALDETVRAGAGLLAQEASPSADTTPARAAGGAGAEAKTSPPQSPPPTTTEAPTAGAQSPEPASPPPTTTTPAPASPASPASTTPASPSPSASPASPPAASTSSPKESPRSPTTAGKEEAAAATATATATATAGGGQADGKLGEDLDAF